ncbi:MAG: hypothetical protein DMF65_06215, partial [Acidobacteria bacterium]
MEGDQYGAGTARCTSIADRNGNFITLDYSAPAGGVTYTDELGRQVVLSGDGATTTVTVKGYGGAPDRVVSVGTGMIAAADSSGTLDNLRADFRSLPRPFVNDYLRTRDYDVPHTVSGPHTDLFPGAEGSESIDGMNVVTRVNLPDGRSLRFRYNQYGEVAEVVYPGGGASQIDYQGFPTSMCECQPVSTFRDVFDRRVVERRSLADGMNVDATWVYTGIGTEAVTLEAHAGDRNGPLVLSEKHFFMAVNAEYRNCTANIRVMGNGTGYEKWQNAKEYRVERQTGTGTQVEEQHWEQRAPVVWGNDPGLTYN